MTANAQLGRVGGGVVARAVVAAPSVVCGEDGGEEGERHTFSV
jgi:hypothetical protein